MAIEEGLIWFPEGGSSCDALLGCIESADELQEAFDYVFVPVGTGATALGIALGLQQNWPQTKVIGVVVLKGADNLIGSLRTLALNAGHELPHNLLLAHDFCGRGFGKIDQALLGRMERYEKALGVVLEPIYTVKMIDCLLQYRAKGVINKDSKVLLWHTGGLQGRRGCDLS